MKIIKTGTTYRVYDESLIVLDSLPAQTYNVCFAPLAGFYLEKHADIKTRENKIYGTHEEKSEKVLKRFKNTNKNLGIILSGDKGIGKSLFARLLSEKAVALGYPVLIVSGYNAGIADFLESIKQEVVVLFDEFDKTFSKIDGVDPQETMLSLFDGISSGKKMFIITCNNYRCLNDYLVNRPGRFHYHLRFGYPSPYEVETYLKDKLEEKYWGEIKKVVSFSTKINLNFDCLSAIASELNDGEKFEAAILDLNIIKEEDNNRYNLILYTSEGMTFCKKSARIDMFDGQNTIVWFEDDEYNDVVGIRFKPNSAVFNAETGEYRIPIDEKSIEYDEENFSKELVEKYKKYHYTYLTIKQIPQKSIHYIV